MKEKAARQVCFLQLDEFSFENVIKTIELLAFQQVGFAFQLPCLVPTTFAGHVVGCAPKTEARADQKKVGYPLVPKSSEGAVLKGCCVASFILFTAFHGLEANSFSEGILR
jgi:hypothetical protein